MPTAKLTRVHYALTEVRPGLWVILGKRWNGESLVTVARLHFAPYAKMAVALIECDPLSPVRN